MDESAYGYKGSICVCEQYNEEGDDGARGTEVRDTDRVGCKWLYLHRDLGREDLGV